MTSSQTLYLFLDLAVILGLARALGVAARALGQPAVIGEILAGILLGPTLLGAHLADVLFPADVRPLLSTLVGLGVVLGLGLELGLLDGTLYSLMVVMAVVSTALTGPLLNRILPAPGQSGTAAGPSAPADSGGLRRGRGTDTGSGPGKSRRWRTWRSAAG
ncbi:hypothetical protein [Streptomyces avermitilis]|uniref:hypothetical protein n=1 Tax=Streptomyces avermitilis TaxID=33903 RepID=UPI0033BA64B6